MTDSPEVSATPVALARRFRRECGLTPKAAEGYQSGAVALARHLEARGLGVADVDGRLLGVFLAGLADGHTPATARDYAAGAKAFLLWLAGEGLVARPALAAAFRRVGWQSARAEYGDGAIEPELIDRYLLSMPEVSPRAKQGYASSVRYFSRFLGAAGATLDGADAATMAEFSVWLKGRYAPSVAKQSMTNVRAFMRWMEREGLHGGIEEAPWRRGRGEPRLPLTPETARLVISAAERGATQEIGLRDRVIVELILACALRTGEIRDLNVEDVSFVGGHGRHRRSRERKQALLRGLRAQGNDRPDQALLPGEGRQAWGAARDNRGPALAGPREAVREGLRRGQAPEDTREGGGRGDGPIQEHDTHVRGDSRVARGY